MQAGYFKTAWNDIKNSPGWKGKMFLMALIMLGSCVVPIVGPILGAIVVNGYLYGWARDIAWGVQGPLPQRIFGNEDGKLYSRGFFISVLAFVLALIPGILYVIYLAIIGVGTADVFSSSYYSGSYNASAGGILAASIGSLVFYLLYIVTLFAINFFIWVGSMRISIYGRLSAGFQFKKIWAMIRHDMGGILRIFGMNLLVGLIVGVVITFVGILLFGLIFALALGMSGGNFNLSGGYGSIDGALIGLILSVVGIAIVVSLVLLYFMLVVSMWIETLTARALGYWVRQFDVPAWRGQDDPMPFELQQQAVPVNPTAVPGQPYGQTPPPAGQPVQPPVGQPVQPPVGQPIMQTPPQGQAGSVSPQDAPASSVPVEVAPQASVDAPSEDASAVQPPVAPSAPKAPAAEETAPQQDVSPSAEEGSTPQ